MYIVLKVIIDKLTGNFTEYVESRLFRPARMTSTGYSYRDAEASGNLTQTWSFLPDLLNWPSGGSFRRVPAGFGLDSEELMAAPSGVISSARDMVCAMTSFHFKLMHLPDTMAGSSPESGGRQRNE